MMKRRKRNTNRKTRRNKQLYKDWKSGEFTSAELVAKYGISNARIYALIKKEKEREGGENDEN